MDLKGIGHAGIKPAVTGKLIPLHKNVFVTDMNFDEQVSKGGIIIPGDDGKTEGIKPRWGRVFAIGPEQEDVQVGQWILIEHGRWTRAINYVESDGTERKIFRVDTNCMLMVSDEQPTELSFGLTAIDLSPPEFNFQPDSH
jgi:co-chaperonin GroES (HSP10)